MEGPVKANLTIWILIKVLRAWANRPTEFSMVIIADPHSFAEPVPLICRAKIFFTATKPADARESLADLGFRDN
jgi:hypothetical protein